MAKQNKGRKFFAASATAALVASAIVPVASAAQVNDYNKISGYAKDAVQALVDQGVIQGDTNGNFNPLNTVTRAQAAEIFTKALELEADGDVNFSDVKKGAWYYNSIAAVVANGIFEGVSANEFAPNKSLTRSEAAKVLVDAFGLEGSESLSQFADASQVKGWAKESLEIAVANGIFTGSEENGKLNLKPNAAITRQDFAVVFARTLDLAVETVDASVKAINNTTVEVTFDEEVDNVEALKFKIEGLEVKNAAVKQTNKNVVVLTTEAQTADKEYVVTLDGETIGKFKGIEAVVPKSIVLKTTNTQGKVGNQVTLTADVGVKAAGIPVTFNVDAPTGSLNKDAVVEVYTNAEGIASYSYTQYAPDADDVTVYPTGAPQLRAFGTVYWGVDNILTIEEVTTGNTLANGVKKTYKVTFKDPKTGAALSNKDLNVSFVENTNVAFNAISKATVTNPATGLTVTPYQATTGYSEEIKVKTDSNGQATFVVSGTNTAVTPYVFVDGSSSVLGVSTVTGTNNVTQATTANKKWEATELTATAAQVKFEGAQLNHQITVERDGEEEAAAQYGSKTNGREYKVKVLDKDGKAYANGLVNIALDEVIDRNLNTNSNAKFKNVEDGTALQDLSANGQQGKIKLNSKGEATVVLYGAKGEVGTPVVWIDQNTSQNNQTGVLEDGEPFFKAPASNFQYERVIGASFKVEGKTSNQNVSSDGIANYTFALTNQSGVALERLQGKMTYEIRNTSGQPIVVKTPVTYRDQNNVAATSFAIQEYGSITITADVINTDQAAFTVETAPLGKAASVIVTPSFVTTNNFDASADNGTTTDARDFNKYVTATGLTATFGDVDTVPNVYTDLIDISSINTTNKTIKFEGKATPVKYAGETGKTYKYYGIGSTPIATADNFIAELQASPQKVRVTYQVIDDVVSFYIINTGVGTGVGATVVQELNNAVTDAAKEAVLKKAYPELSATQVTALLGPVKPLILGGVLNATNLQAAYDALFVSVKSAVAFDTNADGKADQIKITFKENVTAGEKTDLDAALTKFTLDNGTIAGPSVLEGTDTLVYTVNSANGLNLGNLKATASTTADIAAQYLVGSTTAVKAATVVTGVTVTPIVPLPGTAGTAQKQTLTAPAAATTGTAVVTVAAKGFNGNAPLNVDVLNIIGSDVATAVGTKVYNALIANATVTGFFNVTQGATTDEVILTAKTPAANDTTMAVTLANNVPTTTAANTAGVAPGKETIAINFATGATNAGTVSIELEDGAFKHTVSFTVAAGDTLTTVAAKAYAALSGDTKVTGHYEVASAGVGVTLTEIVGGVGTTTTVTVK
ncbi:S-layer homology domain-containing protein [Lysinibacillus fusiformis]|uniref:S-layer homology domain-containing protein n=1 Tax=Lysinibacillus sp. PWR01 TaxID=3342384 RepID=UPI00372D567F